MPAAESALSLVILAAVSMFAAATSTAMHDTAEALRTFSIMGSTELRGWSICGALGGSVASVIFFRVRDVRDLARKLVGSSIAGILFGPMVLRWLGWTPDIDNALGVCAVTSLVSWSLLQWLVPLTPRIGAWFLTKFLGMPPSEPAETKKLK